MTDDVTEADPPPPLLERLLPPVEQHDADGNPMASRMTPREQLVAVGLGFANVAIVAGTAAGVKEQQALVVLAGLVASVISVVGARVGNRLLAMTGLFGSTLLRPGSTAVFFLLVFPYYGAFVWMFLKYNRLTKAKNIRIRQQRQAARTAAKGTGSGSSTRAATKKGKSSGSGAKARPTASKRYTPPKVKRRPPPPPAKPPPDRSLLDRSD
jgi:hypothetical protein